MLLSLLFSKHGGYTRVFIPTSFLTLERLHGHFDEAVLGVALGERVKSSNGLSAIILSQRAGLFNTVALVHNISGL